MKNLFLCRHAKTEEVSTDGTDFNRQLKQRGIKQAEIMGALLCEKGLLPDSVISSSADRALHTAKILCQKLSFPEDQIITHKEIYAANPSQLLEIILKCPKEIETLYFVGHNPGISQLASQLCGEYFPQLPTMGVCSLSFNVEDWVDLAHTKADKIWIKNPSL